MQNKTVTAPPLRLIKQLKLRSTNRVRLAITACLFIVTQIIVMPSVPAATIIISDHGDVSQDNDNKCTLREAVRSMNAGSVYGGGVNETGCINFGAVDFGTNDLILIGSTFGTTINLNQVNNSPGYIIIRKNMTIKAVSDPILIQGDGSKTIFTTYGAEANPVRFENLNFTGGGGGSGGPNSSDESGGAIKVDSGSTLILSESNVYGNSGSLGGGVFVGFQSDLTLINSSVTNNVASSSGGGIYASRGDITLINSTISGNQITNGGDGGGIGAFGGNINLVNSTISKNLSTGVNASGAIGEGGGINTEFNFINQVMSSLLVTNSTISGHVRGGIFSRGVDVTLSNSIIAYSDDADDCVIAPSGNTQATFTASRFNLIEDGSCNSSALSGDPLLGALKDNGGSTLTHALLPGSPAVSAGDNAVCAASPVNNLDQRGLPRPSLGGTICELGAYESGEGKEETNFYIIRTRNGKTVTFGL